MKQLAATLRTTHIGVLFVALWLALVPLAQPVASAMPTANFATATLLADVAEESGKPVEEAAGAQACSGGADPGDESGAVSFAYSLTVPPSSRNHVRPPSTGPPPVPTAHHFRARAPPVA